MQSFYIYMLLRQIVTNSFLFLMGLFGIFLNRRHILLILICIEILLLSINLNFLMFSIQFDDIYGQVFSFFILTIAASESAIGLAIIILYYRIKGSIVILNRTSLKG